MVTPPRTPLSFQVWRKPFLFHFSALKHFKSICNCFVSSWDEKCYEEIITPNKENTDELKRVTTSVKMRSNVSVSEANIRTGVIFFFFSLLFCPPVKRQDLTALFPSALLSHPTCTGFAPTSTQVAPKRVIQTLHKGPDHLYKEQAENSLQLPTPSDVY